MIKVSASQICKALRGGFYNEAGVCAAAKLRGWHVIGHTICLPRLESLDNDFAAECDLESRAAAASYVRSLPKRNLSGMRMVR